MSVAKILLVYLLSFGVFLAIDSVWLLKISPKLYKNNIGHLMADKPQLWAALLFYLIFIAALLVLVLIPALNDKSLAHAAAFGAVFGLVTYATFDLTSQAVFKDWPTKITILDLVWGTSLTTLVSVIVYWLSDKFIV
ncbi:MAG: DUF2177 family protein [Candidatus Saccharibacteria bacterium]